MQLLQKLRDSDYITRVEDEVSGAEVEARNLSREIVDFLRQSRGNIILYTYTGFGHVPANLMYWFSLTFRGPRYPVVSDAEEASLYISPYRDDISLLIFSTGEYSKLITVLQATRILGLEYKAFAPQPLQENLKAVIKGYDVKTLSHQDKFKLTLIYTMSAYFALTELYRHELSSRGRRLHEHGLSGFTGTVRSFIDKYISVLDKVFEQRDLVLVSTGFTEAPVVLLTHALRRLGLNTIYIPIDNALDLEKPILAVFLSTEDRIRRELTTSMRKPVIEFSLNTDPLEASIYLVLLAFIITRP